MPEATALEHVIRPAAGEPAGALVLFHGRGTSEHDLVPLLDMLDPDRRLLGITPRGPLSLPPGGAHWYAVAQIGFAPTVEGLDLDLAGRAGLPVAIGHGEYDPIIGVEWGRDARDRLTQA